MIKEKKLLSFPSMRKHYFVSNNLLGEWGSMQMTVMREGLLLNSKFEPKPNLSKTLKGLLMRLVIFDNTFFQLNSLTTCAGQRWIERKGAVRLCSFVFCSTLLNISSSWSIWFRFVSVLSGFWNGHRKSVWISMITGIITAPPIKVVVPHTHVSKPFKLAPTSLSRV